MSDVKDYGQDQTEAPTRHHKRLWYVIVFLTLAIILIWGLNYILVASPVEQKLSADTRNSGCSLRAHYQYYLSPSTLVLDLTRIENVASVDLFRILFHAAQALHESGRRFDKVVLARAGTPVFQMKGEEFATIGLEFGAGQNPVYLIRTLPEKLYRLGGEAAFGHWEGGLLGVLSKQMQDANLAAQQWAKGE
jgi:hypothetical protein